MIYTKQFTGYNQNASNAMVDEKILELSYPVYKLKLLTNNYVQNYNSNAYFYLNCKINCIFFIIVCYKIYK